MRLENSSFKFAQSVGVDTGSIRVARAGVRNDNDLVRVGRVPNIAAKLSSIRESGFSSYVTEDVYEKLYGSAKISSDGRAMWEQRSWQMATLIEQKLYTGLSGSACIRCTGRLFEPTRDQRETESVRVRRRPHGTRSIIERSQALGKITRHSQEG